MRQPVTTFSPPKHHETVVKNMATDPFSTLPTPSYIYPHVGYPKDKRV
jgi:hypothetical protein